MITKKRLGNNGLFDAFIFSGMAFVCGGKWIHQLDVFSITDLKRAKPMTKAMRP